MRSRLFLSRLEIGSVKKQDCFGQMVVPAALIFVDKNPQKSQSQKKPWQNGECEPQKSLFPTDGFLIQCEHFYFPGAQTQSLSAVSPKPGVKEKTDQQ